MINKSMNDKLNVDPVNKVQGQSQQVKVNKPNELGGLNLSSHIKIYDPKTGEVLVQKRGDS